MPSANESITESRLGFASESFFAKCLTPTQNITLLIYASDLKLYLHHEYDAVMASCSEMEHSIPNTAP
jgi:hypothetical protein